MRRNDDGDVIVLVQDEVALRDIGLTVAADHAQQHVRAEQRIDLADRHAVQAGLVRNFEVEQLDTSAGKRADADGRRESDQTRNNTRGGQLGVDDHRNTQLIADKAEVGYIFRIAHTRNGVAAGCFTSDQAGKQVDFVMGGNGDEQVGILHAGFTQNVIAGAAALYCSKVVHIGKLVQPAFGQVNQCQVVSGRAELSCQLRADFAAAYNNDAHSAPPIYFSIAVLC